MNNPLCLCIYTHTQVLEECDEEKRKLVLSFTTGSNKVPLDGFDPPFTLTSGDDNDASLPTSHTCFNQLALPMYKSYESLKTKLLMALEYIDKGFYIT